MNKFQPNIVIQRLCLFLGLVTLVACLQSFCSLPALADALSDCQECLNKGDASQNRDWEIALKHYQRALTLAGSITPKEKSEEMARTATISLGRVYFNSNQHTQAEKCFRDLIKMCESSKTTPWRVQAAAYQSLGGVLLREGKQEEGQKYLDRYKSFEAASFEAAQLTEDKKELTRLLADYDADLKRSGGPSTYYFVRSIAQWYIVHNQFEKALPYCQSLVEFCKNPKNYFDAGAEWDERRRRGEPTEGTETFMINGKPTAVPFIDNRRPSGKLDRSELVRSLVALSQVNEKLGKTREAHIAMDEAKSNYQKYQMENLAKLFQSFEAFVAASEHGTSVGQSKTDALLSW